MVDFQSWLDSWNTYKGAVSMNSLLIWLMVGGLIAGVVFSIICAFLKQGKETEVKSVVDKISFVLCVISLAVAVLSWPVYIIRANSYDRPERFSTAVENTFGVEDLYSTNSGYNDTDFIMGVEDMKDHLPSDGKYPDSYIKDLKVGKGIVVVDGSKVGLTDSAGNYLKEKNNVN